MSNKRMITVDGNEACASVAYRTTEISAIYPITPSSTMGELADQWAAEGRTNIWGIVPEVTEMQSEGGAAGAVHGVIQAGALGATYTSSQGLLLMIPNMYKIAGELTPFVIHVAARTLATHAVSMYGDHSDVMGTRQTGFALLSAASVQEAQDMAAVAQMATLKGRVPFVHFFDGFRTSHEVAKIEALSDDELRELIDDDLVREFRRHALTPDRPVLRGTAQVPEAFFQATEARSLYYKALPGIVQEAMDRFARVTGRAYKLFDYSGDPEAREVVVIMGSGGETAASTVVALNRQGRKVGVIQVRLFQPFSVEAFVAALPPSVRTIAVLDRCREAGPVGEPLYLAVVAALSEAKLAGLRPRTSAPRVIGGCYGLSSKEFTPAMVKAVFDEARARKPKPHFSVGITDDVGGRSLTVDPRFTIAADDDRCAVFFGLGSDGTVGANKNTIKIVANSTELFAQAYFVYDSKKSGGVTVSHLRFSPRPIQAPYLVQNAEFVACHHFVFLDRYDVLKYAAKGATFLINAPYPAEAVWDKLPRPVQQAIIGKGLKVYTINAHKVAQAAGMGLRINTVMQVCHFALSDVLPPGEAIASIKKTIEKTYGRKGRKLVEKNFAAVDLALADLVELKVPTQVTSTRDLPPVVPANAPEFVRKVTALMLADKGDQLPVSAFPADGTWPLGTAKYEKRNIASEIPVWEPGLCIQCNKCTMVCPHAAIRAKAVPAEAVAEAPATLKSLPYKGPEIKGATYLLQVAPEDCTGCTLCVHVCPGKDPSDASRAALAMAPKDPLLAAERGNFDFFLALPDMDRADIRLTMKTSQLMTPLFEFSGACTGCGETPYIKTITQLFGDRVLVANASGCSSVFGGYLPTVPYTTDRNGRGPSWSNSLFEDNAEFGMGYRLALDHHSRHARALLKTLADRLPQKLVDELLESSQGTDREIKAQRQRVAELRRRLDPIKGAEASRLAELADYLVEKVVFIIGGDGWAYDIGYGGLDHVLASGRNVNIMVLDTEVYSNTGGQASKATPLAAVAKFASNGKERPKKDLGLMAMSYGTAYVAQVAFGAKDAQTVLALQEAASYDGVSLIIGYAHCIAHGYDMATGLERQKQAVQTGYWPLYRYDPRRVGSGEPALQLDCALPTQSVASFMESETRFRITAQRDPLRYQRLVAAADLSIQRRFARLERMATCAD